MSQRIDYIEFKVANIARAKTFYGSVFGWTFKDFGPEYCEFDSGSVKGGFTTQGAPSAGGPLVVIKADNLEGALEAVEQAGGKVTKPIFAFPGGRRFHFVDPNGYELGVWTEKSGRP